MLGYFKYLIRIAKYGWQYLKTRGFRKNKKPRMSRGEALINVWLSYSDVSYISQYHVKLLEKVRKTNNVYIDFMVYNKGKKYAIEYNGRQHYEFVPFFHKTIDKLFEQQRRDKLVKEWCENNGIIFVEIPYSWNDDKIIAKLKEITE